MTLRCHVICCTVCVYVISFIATASTCPASCRCGGDQVDCRNSRQVAVPSNIPTDVANLDLGDNYISGFNKSSFVALSQLRELQADGCQLTRLEKDSFRYIQTVEILDLSRNWISEIDPGTFYRLTSLRVLRLSFNNLGVVKDSLPSFLFRGLSLDVIDLTGNNLTDLGNNVFERSKEIKALHLNKNNFRILRKQVFSPLENSLKTLTVSKNACPLTADEDIFDRFNFNRLELVGSGVTDVSFIQFSAAERLDLSDNPLIFNTFVVGKNLARVCRELLLSGTGLESLNRIPFSSLRFLSLLDLSKNRFKIDDGEIFKSLVELRTLELSDNLHLSKLPTTFGASLANLENLNFSGSGLISIDPESFSGANRLQTLDLSRNKLQTIPESFVPVINTVSSLNLSGNPLHCNCELRWFRVWLSSTAKQTGPHRCTSPTHELLLDVPPSNFICTPPVIIDMPSNMTTEEGTENLLFLCTAQSDPAASVVWTSPNQIKHGVTPSEDRTRNKTLAYWRFSRIGVKDEGWYVCNATNMVGSQVSRIFLTVSKIADRESSTVPEVPVLPEVVPTSLTSTRNKKEKSTDCDSA